MAPEVGALTVAAASTTAAQTVEAVFTVAFTTAASMWVVFPPPTTTRNSGGDGHLLVAAMGVLTQVQPLMIHSSPNVAFPELVRRNALCVARPAILQGSAATTLAPNPACPLVRGQARL